MEMQLKPRDLFLLASQAVERNWKPADVANLHGCLLAPDSLFGWFSPAAQS